MTCEGNVCGTGGWDGPKPGDPDNNVALRANAVYGGIDVSFTYPTINPYAVAHTLLFRGVTDDFAQAAQRAVMNGSIFYDKIDVAVNTDYYYWIRIVSVNGTLMDPVGPASATAVPLPVQTLASLTGLIDAGVLAQSLKEDISGITANNNLIHQEILDRLNGSQAFSDAMAQLNAGLAEAVTVISTETQQRTDGDNALAQSITTLAAANSAAMAAIQTEQTARVTADSATASQVTSLTATVNNNYADIENTLQVHSTNISANATSVSSLSTRVDGVSTSLSTVTTTANTANTAVTALASRTTTVEASLNGNTSTGQIGLTTFVGTLNDTIFDQGNTKGLASKVTDIGALYTAKLEVNGLIGGFGVYNDGTSVQAGFDVDVFWVGRTDVSGTKVKPFIVSGGNVYMQNAFIQNAAIDTLKVAGSAITGLSATTGGASSVPSGGATTLLYAAVSMPDNAGSGVVCMANVALYCDNDASCFLNIYKNGSLIRNTGISLRGGYHNTFSLTAFDASPSAGSNSYSFGVSNNSSGPGANQSVSVDSSSFVVSGAKR